FRNEGVDSTHSPEFAMLEAYEAYGDYDTMAVLTQDLVQRAAQDALGTTLVTLADGTEYDLGGEWTQLKMYDSLSDALGETVTPETSVETLLTFAEKLELSFDPKNVNHGKLVEGLWEHLVGDHLVAPTFVRDFPVETSPLTRDHRTVRGQVEKWDLYVRGVELDGVLRARRSRRAAPALRGAGPARGGGRRGGHAHRRGLPHRDGVRHAAVGRHGPRHRPPPHGAHRPRHPRDHPLPAREARAAVARGRPRIDSMDIWPTVAALIPSIGVGV